MAAGIYPQMVGHLIGDGWTAERVAAWAQDQVTKHLREVTARVPRVGRGSRSGPGAGDARFDGDDRVDGDLVIAGDPDSMSLGRLG